jgi:hypothetical protein
MKRIAVAVALLAGLAGCGPDCDRFCKHWVGDCATQLHIKNPNVNLCITSCNEVGSDYAAFINCAIDKSCADLGNGACQIPSTPPGFTQAATALIQQ